MLRRSNAIRNGLILFVLLLAYFLLLDALGVADNIYLLLINYVFIIGILINTIKHSVSNGEGYINKFFIGVATIVIGIGLSILALYFYFIATEPSIERYVIPIIAASNYSEFCLALLIESISSSIVLVFILLQFYKNHKPREVDI